MNTSLSNNENENNFFIKSFFESLSNFIKNIKIEIKDTFELLNYPCVYQNSKKKFSVSENEDYKNSLTTNVISKIDKKNIENFRVYQKELHNILQNIKTFNEKYKLDVPLLSIMENLIILHLINEYKINNIVKKIQEHNIPMPELNSDLPDYLIPTLELEENQNESNLNVSISEINNLSINNNAVKHILENAQLKVDFSKLVKLNGENHLNSSSINPSSELNEKSDELTLYKKDDKIHNLTHDIKEEINNERNEDQYLNRSHNNEDEKHTLMTSKKEEKVNLIQNIGLSEETLKLLNLLPKKRKNDQN
ncbi:hypothetical protein PFAG_04834 [Plasmodium falciparum Santa Lucia]|uniref:Uncharacterized protein n=11 Tax=Plasmodium falciparum TaxID=5833 RepID=A0A5K1K8Z5_PLAF7|nr:conserved Plasmodium protein, unknown function [Plasmodium falciparum 3D7]ETW28365.1 hypothetical protein PFFCH_04273 [Plasmodium falciparum FCH/4]ETW34613.1 hypothetical protein PFTANZ_04706 [Plasmodium falciparum Tanzania (2000708)]ETW40639.1 hypothetical protein PFNF135_04945 [Plasmodium falciparum NF135/5.C10]ETW47258.1 hypothetical protein PFMALIP_04610 [Plasmodium falciparum MaliPS096_E11]ETW55642.1 hypothetical protein PFUGPA_02407 [Plasmodium falciparum Palo Alto/Uganda]ETW58066.1 |eukprot:XP_001350209.1 conserved Plasmodium protein, unknown function [Plasmodium falciparum 3D7]